MNPYDASMNESISARFESLSRAENAATKLKALRIDDVNIHESNGGQYEYASERTMTPIAGFNPNFSGNMTSFSTGVPNSGSQYFPFIADGNGQQSQSYILQASVSEDNRHKVKRIIRDHGGSPL